MHTSFTSLSPVSVPPSSILDFKQEMRGTAEIITEDLRLIERFFYQFREVLKR